MPYTVTDCGLELICPLPWKQTDGGRSRYFKGKDAGDCVTRAIAIAADLDYKYVYDKCAEIEYKRTGKRSARNGVLTQDPLFKQMMRDLGFFWTPTMKIGSGCKVHLRPDELPSGRLVCNLSKHSVAVIEGVVYDTHDCTRGGTRCVYGYWRLGR